MTKILKTLVIIFTIGLGSIYAQNVAPNASQKELQERKLEERKQEYISNFLTTIDADDFQKEIIKQKIDSFFEKKLALLKLPYKRSVELQEAVHNLENTHFKDIEDIISEDTMSKIKEMIQGDFDEKKVKKEKRKKGKNKN